MQSIFFLVVALAVSLLGPTSAEAQRDKLGMGEALGATVTRPVAPSTPVAKDESSQPTHEGELRGKVLPSEERKQADSQRPQQAPSSKSSELTSSPPPKPVGPILPPPREGAGPKPPTR